MEVQTKQNKTNLTLGSLFDGSGGFPLAGVIAGITPIFNSEIEPFAVRLTEVRFPTVKHYGDVSKISGADIPPVDIITFGSPCQDMSVAGKRAGLEGSRSNLFYQATRIIKEMRAATDGKYPRYAVWENVPGAFSSNKGEDFRCVLEEMCSIKDPEVSVPQCRKWESAGKILGDGYSIAWRELDAQYWGVPQRRKRIYLVADFGGWSADKILFESEGLSGYSAESFRAWQASAGCVGEGSDKAGTDVGLMFENHSQDSRYTGPLDVAQTVLSTFGTGGNNQPFVVQTPKTLKIRCGCEGGGKGPLIQDNKSATLSTHNDQTLFQPTAFGICSKDSNAMKSKNPDSGFYEADTTRCLDANGGNPSCNQGGMAVVAIEGNGSRPSHHGDGYSESDAMYTLNATEQHAVAFANKHATLSANDGPKGPSSQMLGNPEENFVGEPSYGIDRAAYNQGKNAKYNFAVEEEVEPTMVAKGPGAVAQSVFSSSKASYFTHAEEELANTLVATDWKDPPIINDGSEPEYIVRRLTPTECARLQGFPDWWTDDLADENPSEEEIAKWREYFSSYTSVMGCKEKTDAQIKKFLQEPYTDSAAYKLWGNGIALPNAVFVLSGIVYYDQMYR